LQAIAAEVAQEAAVKEAFARFFTQGVQPLASGQPLRTRTDANGHYFLPIPPAKPGFVTCTPRSNLALTTFVRGRRRGETLRGQDVSPSSQVFAAFVLPQLAPRDVPTVQDNFLFDIGKLREPTDGAVRVETVPTPTGAAMADCSCRGGAPAVAIDNPAAGGAVFVAATLFKGLLLEATAPLASYATLLDILLHRTKAGRPDLMATGEDLVIGGVPEARAPEMAHVWNNCVQDSIERDLDFPLPSVAHASRARKTAWYVRRTTMAGSPSACSATTAWLPSQ
jgi:hypothetical protein